MTRSKTAIDGGTAWRWYVEPDPDREYLAVATLIELRSVWSLPSLEWHTLRIHRQLSRSPGLVGFSVRGRFPYHYWTLSAWTDGKALHGFVRGGEHRAVMPTFRRRMRDFTHVRWKVRGSALPLQWTVGLSRLDAMAARRPGQPT